MGASPFTPPEPKEEKKTVVKPAEKPKPEPVKKEESDVVKPVVEEKPAPEPESVSEPEAVIEEEVKQPESEVVEREIITEELSEEEEEALASENVMVTSITDREPGVTSTSTFIGYDSREPDIAIREVNVNFVQPDRKQPRTNFKKDELDELAQSIEREGLLQPILVREIEDGRYQIIAGERRWQAAKLAGLAKIPVRIFEADDEKSLLLAIIENVQRSDLNPIEEAYGYKRLMEQNKMSQADIAQAVSKARSSIANTLRLLNLPENAQQMLYEERITPGHANAILSIPTEEGKQKLIAKLDNDPVPSVREAEAMARLLSGKADTGAKEIKPPLPQSFKKVARALKEYLGTNVKVRNVSGKNKIEIEFKDEKELEHLFGLLKPKQ